jgi:hypothetical protein
MIELEILKLRIVPQQGKNTVKLMKNHNLKVFARDDNLKVFARGDQFNVFALC